MRSESLPPMAPNASEQKMNITKSPKKDPISRYAAWVLNHHHENLILELKESELIFSSTIFTPRTERRTDDTETAITNAINWNSRHFRINLSDLQSMHMCKLQSQPAKHVVDMRSTSTEKDGPGGWGDILQQYSEFLARHK